MGCENKHHLLALDPAKSKPSVGANFLDGKFQEFIVFKYEDLDDISTAFEGLYDVVVVEKPYIHPKNNPQRQVNYILAVGEIVRTLKGWCDNNLILVESYGDDGWVQQSFGRPGKPVDSETAKAFAMTVAKDDGVKCKNDDYAMAYCLGLWWLRNNRNV